MLAIPCNYGREVRMRKVKYGVGVSLDGYLARLDGSVDWLDRATSGAKDEDFGMTAFFKSIDTVLMGRKTYESAVKLGMSKSGYPRMRNYVFSLTIPPGKRDGVEFVAESPARVIAALKKKPGKDIWLCGGGELARSVLNDGMLDQIILGVAPALIGEGLPTFPPGFPETYLQLAECKKYKGGVVGLTYDVINEPPVRKPAKKKPSKKSAAKRK
jgi:dihydrofolate reductase